MKIAEVLQNNFLLLLLGMEPDTWQTVRQYMAVLFKQKRRSGHFIACSNCIQNCYFDNNILLPEMQPPYGGLLSGSCGGLQPSVASEGPLGTKGDFAARTNGLKDKRTTGLRGLDYSVQFLSLLSFSICM